MVSNNYNYQFIDWSHGPIGNEPFEHIGTLSTHLITPTITLGLSDYINISYTQAIGVRSMGWDLLDESLHHREENSLEPFDNALAGLFGDGRLSIKYLLTNTGSHSGTRIFIGSGLVIPGKSVLTADPFDTTGGEYLPHRHFSLSDGCYKANFEVQYYIKTKPKNIFMPTFYGITFNYLIPLKESDHGYLPGNAYSGIASLIFPTKFKNNWYPKGLSLGFIYMKTESSFWHEDETPNSEAEMYLPVIGLIWNHKKYGSFSLNMRYNQNEAIPEDVNDNKSTSFELSIGYRKTLDYTIPWLYY